MSDALTHPLDVICETPYGYEIAAVEYLADETGIGDDYVWAFAVARSYEPADCKLFRVVDALTGAVIWSRPEPS